MLVKSQKRSPNNQKSTEKFEVVKHRKYCKPRSIENEQINCQNRYETLYTDGNDEESENSSDSFTSSSEETPDNTPKQVQSRISKKKRLKSKSTIPVNEETNRNSTKPIANQWYQLRQDNSINHYISQPPVETVQSSYSNIVSRKKKKIVIFSDSSLKNLRMEEFSSFVKEGEVYLKAFPGARANQLNYQTIPAIQGNNYYAAAIHVGINDLLSSNKSVSDICRDIISIGLTCRSNNISKVFISSIAYSSKINTVLMQRLNRALYDECRQNGFTFVDNGAVTESDLWVYGIHLQESGKRIIANNLIKSFNDFLEPANPFRWYL